ncbi:prepilin-type N-terminal cleavage/methylation domain-containing protein [Solibacillus sp. FSL H8-0538]|uniref:prepilin-type N-terminal cleavage/methylation domain-containing protein n=1 Tax=Solibacillus sp. FSL H8-0538 TaxID=2921400 RepID=UPI0030FAB4AD
MKYKLKKTLDCQKGISLIEVVASIVLISIILISFFGLFIQSAKTGKASEEIVDATYVAQQKMEFYFNFSKTSIIPIGNYTEAFPNNYTIDIEITKFSTIYPNLRKVLVKVCEGQEYDITGIIKSCSNRNAPLKSQLQSIY